MSAAIFLQLPQYAAMKEILSVIRKCFLFQPQYLKSMCLKTSITFKEAKDIILLYYSILVNSFCILEHIFIFIFKF